MRKCRYCQSPATGINNSYYHDGTIISQELVCEDHAAKGYGHHDPDMRPPDYYLSVENWDAFMYVREAQAACSVLYDQIEALNIDYSRFNDPEYEASDIYKRWRELSDRYDEIEIWTKPRINYI